jgi:hypothetical protein
MPSTLVNLRKTLTWKDFGTPKKGAAPAPGTKATAAQTRARPRRSAMAEVIPDTKPKEFRLQDTVGVTIELTPGQVWVMEWVFGRPQTFQDDLLHHEQGHYDLVALFCRDMFIDIMALKGQSFSKAADVLKAVQDVFDIYDPLMGDVHKPYDDDTEHGLKAAEQKTWDGYIQSAFTTPRNPPVNAPDGTPYKVTLASVLRAGKVPI